MVTWTKRRGWWGGVRHSVSGYIDTDIVGTECVLGTSHQCPCVRHPPPGSLSVMHGVLRGGGGVVSFDVKLEIATFCFAGLLLLGLFTAASQDT